MSRTLLFECSTRRPADGTVQTVRLSFKTPASCAANHLGVQWEPCVEAPPSFETSIGFDGREFGASPSPQIGELVFGLGDRTRSWAGLIWKNAVVTIKSAPWPVAGGNPTDASFATVWTGRADDIAGGQGRARVRLLDGGAVLRRPAAALRFGTSGDALLDSADAVKDRASGAVVPLAFGKLLSVPSLLVDRANGVWLFAARPATSVQGFYDGGAAFTMGVARASLAALQANVPAPGAVDYCLDAAGKFLARPWDAPVYPFTADATFGATRAADIASAIVALRGGPAFKAGTVAAFNALQGADCGVFIDDETTIAAVLDRLFAGLGALWKLTSAGTIELRRIDWDTPVLTVPAHRRGAPERLKITLPTAKRSLGYGRNNKVHTEGEIATSLLVGPVDFADVVGDTKPDDNATQNADGGNYIRDARGYDWTPSGPLVAIEHNTGGAVANLFDAHRARIDPGVAGGYVIFSPGDFANGIARYPVTPGETFYAAYWVYRGASDGGANFLLNAYNVDGVYLTTTTVAGMLAADATAPVATWKYLQGSIVIPNGWAYVLPHAGYNGGTGGSLYVGAPFWGKQQPGATKNSARTYRVRCRGFSGVLPLGDAQIGLWNEDTGAQIAGLGVMYTVCDYDVVAQTWRAVSFDTLNNPVMAYPLGGFNFARSCMRDWLGYLNSTFPGRPIIVYTFDEPSNGRLEDGIPAQMYAIGASRAVFGSAKFVGRCAYLLVGMAGAGEGNGAEYLAGAGVFNSPGAWIDVSFQMTPNGVLNIAGRTPSTAQDLAYSDGITIEALKPAEAGATLGATPSQVLAIANALTAAGTAQATADGKIDTFYQTSPPAGSEGDLWFDTDDGYRQYRFTAGSWGLVSDNRIGIAISAAAGAQATADGKVTTFVGETAPTAVSLGDLWFKASTGELRRWNGSTWGTPLADLTGQFLNVNGLPSGTIVPGFGPISAAFTGGGGGGASGVGPIQVIFGTSLAAAVPGGANVTVQFNGIATGGGLVTLTLAVQSRVFGGTWSTVPGGTFAQTVNGGDSVGDYQVVGSNIPSGEAGEVRVALIASSGGGIDLDFPASYWVA